MTPVILRPSETKDGTRPLSTGWDTTMKSAGIVPYLETKLPFPVPNILSVGNVPHVTNKSGAAFFISAITSGILSVCPSKSR